MTEKEGGGGGEGGGRMTIKKGEKEEGKQCKTTLADWYVSAAI